VAIAVELRLPNGPRSSDGPATEALLVQLIWLAERVAYARKIERRGAKAAGQVEWITARSDDLRRGVIGLVKTADRAARDAIIRQLAVQKRELEHELARVGRPMTAEAMERRERTRQRLRGVCCALDLFQIGEIALEELDQAIDLGLIGKLTGATRTRLKTGPEALAVRLEADAVHVCVAGFLSVLRHVLSVRFVGAMVEQTNAGRDLKGRVRNELETFWKCATGSESGDQNGNSELLKCFHALLRDTRDRATNAGRAIVLRMCA
jgi:hypothetical protein